MDENDVRAGINRTLAWLQTNQLWIIGESNKRTVEQLRGYRWDENINPDGTYRKEMPLKVEDDLPDALRYALMLYPELPELAMSGASDALRYATFTEEQRWSVERMAKIHAAETARERGEDTPEEAESALAPGSLFLDTTRRYYGDEDEDGPAGTGDLWG